jgi:hypothetical protein
VRTTRRLFCRRANGPWTGRGPCVVSCAQKWTPSVRVRLPGFPQPGTSPPEYRRVDRTDVARYSTAQMQQAEASKSACSRDSGSAPSPAPRSVAALTSPRRARESRSRMAVVRPWTRTRPAPPCSPYNVSARVRPCPGHRAERPFRRPSRLQFPTWDLLTFYDDASPALFFEGRTRIAKPPPR